MNLCEGNGADHCCYLPGEEGPCAHLEENTVAGRRWACGLYRQLGSWELVHADPRYAHVKVALNAYRPNLLCGDWPEPGETCNECGVKG